MKIRFINQLVVGKTVHKPGDILECNDGDGCHLICSGVAEVVQYSEPEAVHPVSVVAGEVETEKETD